MLNVSFVDHDPMQNYEPDVPITGIRLSDWLHREADRP
jgi:hypothetical protein